MGRRAQTVLVFLVEYALYREAPLQADVSGTAAMVGAGRTRTWHQRGGPASEQSCSFYGYFSNQFLGHLFPSFPDVEAEIPVYYCYFKSLSLRRLMSPSVGFCKAYERYRELRASAGARQGCIKQGLSYSCSSLCCLMPSYVNAHAWNL